MLASLKRTPARSTRRLSTHVVHSWLSRSSLSGPARTRRSYRWEQRELALAAAPQLNADSKRGHGAQAIIESPHAPPPEYGSLRALARSSPRAPRLEARASLSHVALGRLADPSLHCALSSLASSQGWWQGPDSGPGTRARSNHRQRPQGRRGGSRRQGGQAG